MMFCIIIISPFLCRNGDRYEGYWVMDQRHGHGELFCADGSYYVVSTAPQWSDLV